MLSALSDLNFLFLKNEKGSVDRFRYPSYIRVGFEQYVFYDECVSVLYPIFSLLFQIVFIEQPHSHKVRWKYVQLDNNREVSDILKYLTLLRYFLVSFL